MVLNKWKNLSFDVAFTQLKDIHEKSNESLNNKVTVLLLLLLLFFIIIIGIQITGDVNPDIRRLVGAIAWSSQPDYFVAESLETARYRLGPIARYV